MGRRSKSSSARLYIVDIRMHHDLYHSFIDTFYLENIPLLRSRSTLSDLLCLSPSLSFLSLSHSLPAFDHMTRSLQSTPASLPAPCSRQKRLFAQKNFLLYSCCHARLILQLWPDSLSLPGFQEGSNNAERLEKFYRPTERILLGKMWNKPSKIRSIVFICTVGRALFHIFPSKICSVGR